MTYRRARGVLFRAYANEVVVAVPGAPDFELLSGPAADAWALLQDPCSEQEIVATLAVLYQASEGTVKRDIRALLADLESRGLIEAGSDA